jgi:hypothetical protein
LENKNKGVIIIFLFMFLLVINALSISGAPPFIQPTDTRGEDTLTIEYQKIVNLKLNEDFLFDFHVYNTSDGVALKNTSSKVLTCNMCLYKSNGQHLLKDEKLISDGYDFELNVTKGNFTEEGVYSFITFCNTTYQGGFISSKLEVTKEGTEITTERQSLGFIILALLGLIILFIVISFKVDRKAFYSLPLKVSLVWLSVTLIGVLIYTLKKIADFYSTGLSTTMGTLFVVYCSLYVVFVWMMFILFLKDVIIFFKETIKGVKDEENKNEFERKDFW